MLAGEIIVGTAVASWYCGGCAAVKGAAIGSAITGGFGAYSAYQNGGDISKGLLFGAATGAATGALNGWATAKFNFLTAKYTTTEIFAVRLGAGAIGGAAGGATVGYSGGAGSGSDILHGAFHGAIIGAAVAGAFTTIDYLGGVELSLPKIKEINGMAEGSEPIDLSKIPLIGSISRPTVQALSRNPWLSSLAVSGASSYDVLSNGKLSGLALRRGGNCSIKFGGETNCGFGEP